MAALACVAAYDRLHAAQQDNNPDFLLAAMVAPNRLLPIARFAKGTWSNHWPTPAQPGAAPSLKQIPAAWLGGPVPLEWRVWRSRADTSTVRVTGVAVDSGGCSGSEQLLLEYEPKLGAAPVASAEIGLAVTKGRAIDSVDRLEKSSPWRRTVDPAIERVLRDNEARIFEQARAQPPWAGEALSDTDLQALQTQIEWVYRSTAGDTYFFEAAKRTTRQAKPFGLVIRGWLKRDPKAGFVAVGLTGAIFGESSAEADGQPVWIPRAVIGVGPRPFWIFSERGYESLQYSIRELRANDVVQLLTASAGGC